jgi:hypothetical protein
MKVVRLSKLQGATNNGDLRKTAYRILKFEHLVRLFKDRQYVLASPFEWEDPFEKVWSQLVFPEAIAHSSISRRVFGSCLTFQARSDAMWSIYSRNWLGIRVTINLDELQAQAEAAPELKHGRAWLGEVNYLTDTALTQRALELIHSVRTPNADLPEVLVRAWLNKRIAFRHEDEVRLLLVLGEPSTLPPGPKIFKFTVDPHSLISSIHIDPRAPKEVYETLARDIRGDLGFKRSVKQSSLLRLPRNFEEMIRKR